MQDINRYSIQKIYENNVDCNLTCFPEKIEGRHGVGKFIDKRICLFKIYHVIFYLIFLVLAYAPV